MFVCDVCEEAKFRHEPLLQGALWANLAGCLATKVRPAALTAAEYKSDRVAT